MPGRQVATVQNYDFGALNDESDDDKNTVLKFAVEPNDGGKQILFFENLTDKDYSIKVQVSEDDTTYTDAVSETVVPSKVGLDSSVFVRPGKDKFVRVVAFGGTRGRLQIRGRHILDLRDMQPIIE